MLRKNPAFTAVGVIALGLGIGANTAIFSFVYGLLLRPLAFKDLNHLALVWETVPDSGDRSGVSPANFFDWERQNDVFERMTFYRSWDANVTTAGESERVDAYQVSQDFFRGPPESALSVSIRNRRQPRKPPQDRHFELRHRLRLE